MIRGDFGTENVLVKRMQSRFRNEESSAYIDGASTQNQRIECWWGQLRRQHMQYYMDLFKDLRDRNEFSGSELDKNLMQFCFMAVIQVNIYFFFYRILIPKLNANRSRGNVNSLALIMHFNFSSR